MGAQKNCLAVYVLVENKKIDFQLHTYLMACDIVSTVLNASLHSSLVGRDKQKN